MSKEKEPEMDEKENTSKMVEKDQKKEEKKEEKKKYFGKPVKKGDLIKIDKLGRTKSTALDSKSFIFEVSNLEDAKKLPNYDPKNIHQYKPELVLVGEKGFLLDKLSDKLEGMKYGEEQWITLEPKDAFGERDMKKIEKMSYKKFMTTQKEKPRRGMEFHDHNNNRHGTVIYADQGRIRIDFNHPLAGKPVEYRIKPIERIDKFKDKIFTFLERRMPNAVPELFKIDYNEDEKLLNLEIPQYLAMQQNLGMVEFSLSYELQNYLDIDTVNFIHSFKKPPAPDEQANNVIETAVEMVEEDKKKETEEVEKKTKKTTKRKKSSKKTTKKSTKKTTKRKKSSKKSTKKATSK